MSSRAPILSLPAEEVLSTIGASDFEIVSTPVKILVELIPLDEPK